MVAAVSKAGGLGVLGAVAHSPEQLEIDLAWIEDEVGGKPYGVDLIVPAKYAGDGDGGYSLDDIAALIPDTHRAFVDDILARYDVPELPTATPPVPTRRRRAPAKVHRSVPSRRCRCSTSLWRTTPPWS